MLLSPLDLAIRKTHPPRVCDRAVMLLSARSFDAKFDRLYDLSGNGLHAQLGSAVGADTNDPQRLQYRGQKGVYFPGSAGNYLSAPDSAAVSITADIDLRCFAMLPDWSLAGATQYFVAKWNAAGQRSYRLSIGSTGNLSFITSSDGTTNAGVATSTASVPFADFAAGWVRVTRNATTGDVIFYTSTDGVIWTQLGATVAATTGAMFDGNSIVEVGSFLGGTNSVLSGLIYRAQIYNGINGAKVFDFDASQLVEPYASVTDVHGNVITLNRTATGRKLEIIDRDLFLFDGVDDYARVEDHPLLRVAAGPATVVMLCREYDIGPPNESNKLRLSKRAGLNAADAGYSLQGSSTTLNRMVGSSCDGTGGLNAYVNTTPGFAHLYALTLQPGTQRFYSDGVTTFATTGSPNTDNSEPLYIGRTGAGSYGAFAFLGAAVFRSVLSVDELARLKSEMLAL